MANSQPPSKGKTPFASATTAWSLLHWLVRYKADSWSTGKAVRAYFVSIAITYIPLLLAAYQSGNPLWKVDPKFPDRLLFLHDWGIAFAFLVSFPTLVVLMASDEPLLASSLTRVQDDGVLRIKKEVNSAAPFKSWNAIFRRCNIGALLLGTGLGLVLGKFTFDSMKNPERHFWIIKGTELLPVVGYAYFYCIVLLYTLVFIYVARCVVISVFLNHVVKSSQISLLPFHPDKCGGLRPVGRLGLRNQYTLTVLGLNIVLLIVGSHGLPDRLLVEAAVAYLILGPIIFMGPLLPFRRGMMETKEGWMKEAGDRLHIEFEHLRVKMRTSEISKEDEAMIDRLRKVGSFIQELPVWPFDAQTLRTFATAYIVPLGFPLLVHAVTLLINVLKTTGK